MSSSESFRRPTWTNLQDQVPQAAREDFVEESEFARVQVGESPEPSPDEAYRNGLAEGEKRGRDAALKELEPVIQELRSLAASISSVRQKRLDAAESELIQVATDVARRILHGELQQADDVILRMARACVEQAKEEDSLVLHVAPSDLELVRTHVPELELDLADGSIGVQADPCVTPGSVVLQTSQRCYDGRPERILSHSLQQLEAEENS